MENKELLKQEEEKMKAMYSAEPCHLIKAMFIGLLIEATALAILFGIGRILANLFVFMG